MDALQMTIDMKDGQIKDLKDSVVESEIKARKLLDRLNKSESGAAQSNIDQAMSMLNRKTVPNKEQR